MIQLLRRHIAVLSRSSAIPPIGLYHLAETAYAVHILPVPSAPSLWPTEGKRAARLRAAASAVADTHAGRDTYMDEYAYRRRERASGVASVAHLVR